MDESHVDQSVKVLASAANRRGALLSFGAAGMALLAALGFTDVSARNNTGGGRKTNGGSKGGGNSKHRRQDQGAKDETGDETADPGDGAPHEPPDAIVEASGAVQTEGKQTKKRGPIGPTGPTGPTGPALAPVTRFGPEVRETGSFIQSVAQCQAGEHAVGGGHFVNLFEEQIMDFLSSTPSPLTDGTTPTEWVAEVNTTFPGGDKSLRAFVICVPG